MSNTVRKIILSKVGALLVLVSLLLNFTFVQGSSSLEGDEPTATPPSETTKIETSITEIETEIELPQVNSLQDHVNITFKELGYDILELRYPSQNDLELNLPNTWIVAAGEYSYINLHYDMFDERSVAQEVTKQYEGMGYPHVGVYVDQYLAATFIPESGPNHTIKIPIPASAMLERIYNQSNLHTITIDFYSNVDLYCYYDGIITIYPDSTLGLEFAFEQPFRNLANFPQFILEDSFYPETLYFVLPDNYSEAELETAAIIGAAIGENSVTNVKYEVITASEATDTLLATSNAVVIGKSGQNSLINKLTDSNLLYTHLSADNSTTKYMGNDVDPNTGIIQLITSEYSDRYSYLVITANSDEGLLQAAKEFTKPSLSLTGTFALATPTAVTAESETDIDVIDTFTFEDLGIEDRTWYGLNTYSITYTFFVPNNWKMQDGANLVLNYAHSPNLSGSNSALTVRINDRLIGNADVDSVIQGDKQVKLPIEPTDLIPGYMNTIRLTALLAGSIECADVYDFTHWLTIRNTSYIQLNHEPTTQGMFIHPTVQLSYDPRVLFVLPAEPSKEELNGLLNLSLLIGREGRQGQYNFIVSKDPNIELSDYPEYHVVLMGKPSRNTVTAKLNDLLPQPYVPGEDTLMQTGGGVAYQIPSTVDLGVIEVFPATYNATRGITVVSGTTDIGFQWAVDAVTDQNRIWDFTGDVFFVSDTRMQSIYSLGTVRDTIDSIVSNITETETVLETVPAEITKTPAPTSEAVVQNTQIVNKYISSTAEESGNNIGMYLLYGVVGLAVIVLIIGAIRVSRGGRSL